MQCPLCEKTFDFEIKLLEHLEEHKKNSKLGDSKPKEKINDFPIKKENKVFDKRKIFGIETFESSVSTKLNKITNIENLVNSRKFVEQIKKITIKFPFAYVPKLVKEWIRGVSSSTLIETYYLGDHVNLKFIFEDILKFQNKRYYSSSDPNLYEKNLKIFGWKEKFEEIERNCILFKQEIDNLFFKNTLRAFLLIIMMDYEKQSIEKSSLIEKAKRINENYDLFRYVDIDLKIVFEKISETSIDDILNEIIDELTLEKILVQKKSHFLQSNFSLDKIKRNIVTELKFNKNSVSERQLKGIIKQDFPILDFVPDSVIWKTALLELERENIIKTSKRSNFRLSSLIFLNQNYDKILQKIQNLDPHTVKFYGRKISPDIFVAELLELETGDIDDHDDQVTRIAGLILAESLKLIPPKEKLSEFDFAVDITDYSFRQEQLDAMKNLDFQIRSDVFHCKVMVGDNLTMDKLQELKTALPPNQQGIVFTFKKTPQNVKSVLKDDKSIQVINEDGLKTWVGITSTIPSRKNSIAKLYFDPITKLKRKLVKINLVDYESGLATVSILPEMSESTVLVRTLEEIPLSESDPNNFETYVDNYLEFLTILSKLTTPSNLIEGMFNQKIKDVTIHSDNDLELIFEHHNVKLSLTSYSKKHIVICNCLKWAEDKFYLCSHLVSSLDYAFRTFSKFNETWTQNDNGMKHALEMLLKDNTSMVLERLGLEHHLGEIKGDKEIVDFVSAMAKIKKNF